MEQGVWDIEESKRERMRTSRLRTKGFAHERMRTPSPNGAPVARDGETVIRARGHTACRLWQGHLCDHVELFDYNFLLGLATVVVKKSHHVTQNTM